MSYSKNTYFDQQPITTEREEERQYTYDAPAIDFATGSQKQAIIQELARRNHRRLTTAVLLHINRISEAAAAELLAGGLDVKQTAYDAADAAAL